MATRRDDLERLRKRLWDELEGPEITARDVATVAKEIRATWAELEPLDKDKSAGVSDGVVSIADFAATRSTKAAS